MRFYRKCPTVQHICKQTCGITKHMHILLRGCVLSAATLMEACPALDPRLGFSSCSAWQAYGLCDFSLPCVTQGAFHLLFRTAGMKYRNTGWLSSTLPFPLTETCLGASYKAESLVSTFLYMDKLTDRWALVVHVCMLQGGRKWTCIKVGGPNLTSESPRKTGVNRDGCIVGR